MSFETLRDTMYSVSSGKIISQVQNALRGGKETLMLPKYCLSLVAHTIAETTNSMMEEMAGTQGKAPNNSIANIGLHEQDYLVPLSLAMKSLRPDFLSAVEDADTVSININGDCNDPTIIDLDVRCGFRDFGGKITASANIHMHFENPQKDGTWDSHTFSLNTSVGEHCTSFLVCATDNLIL